MRAYPRSRGATATELGVTFPATGLSPLARGNLVVAVETTYRPGPIPARAGQPAPISPQWWRTRAYPRSRGATRETGGYHLAR